MTPFEVLRQHALAHPDAIAASTPYRVASYRKMWSRIERSTARLQCEWAIRPGDTIAYFGHGHLDALVMYFAAARCGARVLPLEHAHLQQRAAHWLATSAATLVLHDDSIALGGGQFTVPCKPLSSLIATICHHRGSVLEDSAAVSLLEFPEPGLADAGSGSEPLELRQRTLDHLAAIALSCPAGHHGVSAALFDPAVFAPVVLATLLAGATLTFGVS